MIQRAEYFIGQGKQFGVLKRGVLRKRGAPKNLPRHLLALLLRKRVERVEEPLGRLGHSTILALATCRVKHLHQV